MTRGERVARALYAAAQAEAQAINSSAPLPSYEEEDADSRRFLLDMAKAAIAALSPDVSQSEGWQPIETAPKDGEPFLAVAEGYLWDEMGPEEDWVPRRALAAYRVTTRVHPLIDEIRSVETGNIYEWTHWMPLPEPPRALSNTPEKGD